MTTHTDRKYGRMVKLDLERAGIPYETPEGTADFHAAGRHTYITELLRSGVSLVEARELARTMIDLGTAHEVVTRALLTDMSVFDNVAFPLRENTDLPERLIGADPDYYCLRNRRHLFDPEALEDYLRCFRNPETIHAICEDYRAGIGIDNIAWECDFPHSDSPWPRSPERLMDEFRGADVEVGAGRGLDPVGPAAQIDVVEVQFEDLFLAEPSLDLTGKADLGEFAAQ